MTENNENLVDIPKRNVIREALIAELQILRDESFKCISEMKSAKTTIKKKYFNKKLKKNNKRLADLLVMIDRLPSTHSNDVISVSDTNQFEGEKNETTTS